MNNNIITTPQQITRVLRHFFTDNNVTTFERDEETGFAFLTSFDATGFMIQADAAASMPRVRLLTGLLCQARPTLDECRQLVNELNRRCHFVSVFVCPEEHRFYLESSLVLGDGQCLQTQLLTLGEAHMSGVARIGPMLGRFSRRECNFEQIELELDMYATYCEQLQEEDIPHRASSSNRWTPPLNRN